MTSGTIFFICLGIFAHIAWWAADSKLQEAKKTKNFGMMILAWFIIFCYPCLFWLCVVRMVFLPLKENDLVITEQKPVAIQLENE